MIRNARYISKRVDDENPYWISFSDLMTGLLVIFILAAVSLIIELTDKSEKVDQSILELKKAEESTLSFGSGQDDLPNDDFVISQVREIGKTIYNTLVKGKRINSFDTIFIEGHTDSDNYWKRKGNWGLSSDRAISVWNAWNNTVGGQPLLAELQNEMGQKLFSVSGYAATRRVNTQELTDADKAQNRRIDIRFTVKKPTIESLQEIKKISTGVINGI